MANNKGIPHKPRGGRPPRLYEALELAWTGLQGKKLGLMERTFVEATLENERRRRAARLRAREEATHGLDQR